MSTVEDWSCDDLSSIHGFEDSLCSVCPPRTSSAKYRRSSFSSCHGATMTIPVKRKTKDPFVSVSPFQPLLFFPPSSFTPAKNQSPPLCRRENRTLGQRGIPGSGSWFTFFPNVPIYLVYTTLAWGGVPSTLICWLMVVYHAFYYRDDFLGCVNHPFHPY